uniref:Protein Wnt n=1 Tax=Petromyzon marinus TaxID=7757 RepID=A0AAJ7SML4_PETMA|nr:protein Wnt-5b-like [Petromyzon marinus]
MDPLRRVDWFPLGLCALAQLWAVASASLWSLALWAPNFDPSEYRLLCIWVPGLSPAQRRICLRHRDHVAHVAEGVHLALSECRHQFQGKRWNCTVPGAEDALDLVAESGKGSERARHIHSHLRAAEPIVRSPGKSRESGLSLNRRRFPYHLLGVFSPKTPSHTGLAAPSPADGAGFTHDAPLGVSPGSREAAFVSAVTAAGVAHAVARACRQGALQGACSWVVPHAMKLPLDARRGGSGDDVEYGYQFAKWFVDAGDRNRGSGQGGESLALNLHNNEAGRLAVYNLAYMGCKCHELFGTCMLKICWQQLADFRSVGNFLKEKYDKSSAVQLVSHNGGGGAGGANGSRGGAARWPRRRLEAVNERLTAPTVSDLVHVNASPEYCERDETDGVPGTVGPQCSVTSEGATEGRCVTCCDRGYDTSQGSGPSEFLPGIWLFRG